MLETAVKALPKRNGKPECTVFEPPVFVNQKLLPLLGSNQGSPEDGVLALRNVLAHSGRLSEADEQRFTAARCARFEHLIRDASFFADVKIVGSPTAERAFLLHGVPEAGISFATFGLNQLPPGVPWPQPG